MKRKLIIITIAALVTSACSVNLQTTGGYVDDIYYWPGDDVPNIVSEELGTLMDKEASDNGMIILSEVSVDEDGTNKVKNYIYADDEPDWFNEVQVYNLESLENGIAWSIK